MNDVRSLLLKNILFQMVECLICSWLMQWQFPCNVLVTNPCDDFHHNNNLQICKCDKWQIH